MSKLNIVVEYDDLGTNTNISCHTATLQIQDVLLVNISDKISADPNNDLKLGSDNKLVSQPNDVNFLAYYILSKG